MKEVNINWKMLTNLRPGNKADEIFFAQWEKIRKETKYFWDLHQETRNFLRYSQKEKSFELYYHRLVDLERLKRSTRREEEEARVSSTVLLLFNISRGTLLTASNYMFFPVKKMQNV